MTPITVSHFANELSDNLAKRRWWQQMWVTKLGIGVNVILLFLSGFLHRLSLEIRSAAMGVTPTLAQPVAVWKGEPLPVTSSSRQNSSQYLLIYPQLRILSADRESPESAQNFRCSSPLVTALLSCFCKDHVKGLHCIMCKFWWSRAIELSKSPRKAAEVTLSNLLNFSAKHAQHAV